MAEHHRAERVAEALREELEELIGYELTDPRLGSVWVSEVQVSPDMRLATVRVGAGGDEASREDTLRVLVGARGFLRRQLAQRIQLFRIPELRFEPDSTIEAGRVERLLKRIRKGRPRDTAGPDEASREKKPVR